MAGPIRSDIEADNWQTYAPDDWSWLDYIKAGGSDARNALSSLGSNLIEGMSPFHPNATQHGQPSLQVPPMIQGIADSYSRLAGTPSKPGNAYDLTGVPELDAPIQGDMSNVLLSLYGGNALAVTKPKGALGAGAAREGAQPIMAYHGTSGPMMGKSFNGPSFWASERPDVASKYATGLHRGSAFDAEAPNVLPVEMFGKVYDATDLPNTAGLFDMARQNARDVGADIIKYIGGNYEAINRGTVKSPLTGETLFSDTGRPSIAGSALATAGEQPKGNALNPLAKRPVGSVGSAPAGTAEAGSLSFRRALPSESDPMSVFTGKPSYIAEQDGFPAGRFYYDELPNAVNVIDAKVHPDYQRQGIASKALGFIQDDLGKPLTPDVTLTNDGYALWKSSYPDAVRDYVHSNGAWRPSGAEQNLQGAYDAMAKGVPSWRTSGGPNRPSDVLWSDTGKPSIIGSALATAGEQPLGIKDRLTAAYKTLRYPDETPRPDLLEALKDYTGLQQQVNALKQTTAAQDHVMRTLDSDLLNDTLDGLPADTGYLNALIRKRKVEDGTLFSDTGKPSLLGSALATAGEQPTLEDILTWYRP